MFSIVPRTIWQKLNPPDEKNLCTWAQRTMVVKNKGHTLLIDTGLGNKQSESFFKHYEPQGPGIVEALQQAGIQPEEITDVLLTHLHFDHCGGAVTRTASGRLVPAFPRAVYWSNRLHWEWARHPNIREKASFLWENFIPLEEAGVVRWALDGQEIIPGVHVRFCYGHTEAMMIAFVEFNSTTLVYVADLIPSSYHVPLPYLMSYDVRPLQALEEKKSLLEEAVAGRYILVFEHDPHWEVATLQEGEKYPVVERRATLQELLAPSNSSRQ